MYETVRFANYMEQSKQVVLSNLLRENSSE